MSSFSRSKNLTSSPKATISDESPTSPTRRIRLSDTHWRRFCEIVIWHGWRLQHTSLVLPNWYQWPAPSRLACRKPSSFLTPTCTTDLSPSHPNLIQRQVSNKPWLKRRGPEILKLSKISRGFNTSGMSSRMCQWSAYLKYSYLLVTSAAFAFSSLWSTQRDSTHRYWPRRELWTIWSCQIPWDVHLHPNRRHL